MKKAGQNLFNCLLCYVQPYLEFLATVLVFKFHIFHATV